MLKIAAFTMMVLSAGYTYYARNYLTYQPPTTTYPDRAPLTDIPRQSVQIETNVGESKEIPLRGGSRILLRPNSRFTFGYLPMPGMKGLTAVLDGEMAIELTKEDFVLDLRTSSGRAMFSPGTYAVRCEAGCTAMLLTVGVGTVRIRGDSTTGMTLTAGEKGMVPKRGAPEKVTPGDGWPALQPAKVP